MADQETIPIGLETQNKVAEAIYLRWYSDGRRCIARTDGDVVIDGRLELFRRPDGTASLRFQGIENDIISHDPNTCSNSMGDGIRSLAIYGKE